MVYTELKERLYGGEALCVRLSVGEKAFLAPLKVSAAQKEDVVIVWLSQLLANKVVALSQEEQVAAWTTLDTLLRSGRLKALCSINWICPLTSNFTEALVDIINSSADAVLREKAMNVCHGLMTNPALTPLLTHSLGHCLLLSKGLITWLQEGHLEEQYVGVASAMIAEVATRLQSHRDKLKGLSNVAENLLLPSVKLAVSAKDDVREVMQDLLKATKALISTSLFHEDLQDHYQRTFTLIFSETKAIATDDILKFLILIVSYIDSEPLEVVEYLLGELYCQFVTKYSNNLNMQCQMLVVLSHTLGFTIESPSGPSIVKNSFSGRQLAASNIDAKKREVLLHSLLRTLRNTRPAISKDTGINVLLKKLGESLVGTAPVSCQGYKCLEILLALFPTFMSNLVMQNVWKIYCYQTPGDAVVDATGELYSMFDELLCRVLEVYVRLRHLHKMYSKILCSIRDNRSHLENQDIIPETLYAHDDKSIFPPRFLALSRTTLNGVNHKQALDVWRSVLAFLDKENELLLKAAATKPGHLEFVSLVVWLLAVVVEASPALEVATAAGGVETLANIMAQIAVSGIKPLATVMLTHPHNNSVCASFLLLCHTWGELHTSLLTTDVGYRDRPSTPKVHPFNATPPTDFSHLFPFILPDAWAQISARVANFGNKAAKLALVQLVLQKFSLASLEHHKGVQFQDAATEHTALAVTQKTIDAAGKYLTNALESWGSDVSRLFTVHLAYLLPALNTSNLSVISRHLVRGVREGEVSWVQYTNSISFEEASPLHPEVFCDVCGVLASLSASNKRKLSECEEGPASTKNYCLKILKKLSKASPLLVKPELAGKEEELAVFKLFEECGEYLRKLIEKEPSPWCAVQQCHAAQFAAMIKLITKFPLQHLNSNLRIAILFALFSLLIQESGPGKEEQFFDIVKALNEALALIGTFRVFTYIKAGSVMRWFIEKRAALYGAMLSEHMASLPHTLIKKIGIYSPRYLDRQNLSCDVQNRYNFDYLVVYLTFKLMRAGKALDQVKEVAEYITSGPSVAVESLLQPAVFLLAACHLPFQKESPTCVWVRQHLSSWILSYLKKMDIDTACPATAATILTAHTIIVQTLAPTIPRAENTQENGKSQADTPGESAKPKDGEAKEGSEAVAKESNTKKLKWKKLLGRSVQLSELCLSSGNKELEEYALAFLTVVAEHSEVLDTYVPSQLLSNAWTALSCPDRCPSGIDTDVSTKVSLEPVLLTASADDYEELLGDLVMRTHTNTAQLRHTLQLWRLVINSMALGVNGYLKRIALEHLIPILVHLATTQGSSDVPDAAILHDILQTLQVVIHTSISFQNQTKAHLLVPCSTIHLHKLPRQHFSKIFNTTVNIVNTIVMQHPDMVMERTPAVLAAVAHLTTTLIAQASQENKLDEAHIKVLVDCTRNVERLVKELRCYQAKLNKVVHFTMATIVTDLQRTTVYPAVKKVIESIVYRLLDLCDHHCLQHLLVVLPPATTTLLKHLHDSYSIFHRYNPGKA